MSSIESVPDAISPELAALNVVVRALRPLAPELRRRVIDSALVLLGAPKLTGETDTFIGGSDADTAGIESGFSTARVTATDIRQLKEQKSPASANEMAALVAYYLTELVEAAHRKATVDINDILKYFKQAQFRLPNNPKMLLVNAKNAGYFDAVGGGQYKLNPVGYNLVVHSLPRSGSKTKSVRTNRRSPATISRKASSKKAKK